MPFGSSDLGFGLTFALKDAASGPAKKIASSFDSMRTKADKLGKDGNASLMAFSGGIAQLATVGAIVAPFAMAINKAAEFGASLTRLSAITGSTTEQMKQLKAQALDLGATTEFSAKQAADGMNFLAMAGFNTNQIMTAMPDVLNLATIAQTDLAKTADIASNIMSGFGLEAKDMNRVVDVMAKTMTKSNVNIVQMAESMKLIAPQAKALGVTLEEVSATVGLLGDNGLQGSVATAAMRTAIGRLSNPTKQMNEIMKQTGIRFFNADGKFKGIVGTLREVEKATQKMTDQERLKTMSVLFGRSANQFTALMNTQKKVMRDGVEVTLQGADALENYTNTLNMATGAGEAMAKQMRSSFGGSMKALNSVFETLMINIGDALIPLLKPLLDLLVKVLSVVAKFIQTPFGKWLVAVAFGIGVVVASMIAWQFVTSTMIPLLFSFGGAVSFALWPITLIVAAVVTLIFIFKELWTAITTGEENVVRFGVALGVLMGPIGWIVTGLAGLNRSMSEFDKFASGGEKKGGILGFFQKVGGVITAVGEIWNSFTLRGFKLSAQTEAALEKLGIMDLVKSIGGWMVRVKRLWEGLKNGFINGFKSVGKMVSNVGEGFQQMFISIKGEFSSVADFFGGVIDRIKNFFIDLYDSSGIFGTIFRVLVDPFILAWNAIKFVWVKIKDLFNELQETIAEIWDSVNAVFDISDSVHKVVSETNDGEENNITKLATNNLRAQSLIQEVEQAKANAVTSSSTTTSTTINEGPGRIENVIMLDGDEIARSVNDRNQLEDEIN